MSCGRNRSAWEMKVDLVNMSTWKHRCRFHYRSVVAKLVEEGKGWKQDVVKNPHKQDEIRQPTKHLVKKIHGILSNDPR